MIRFLLGLSALFILSGCSNESTPSANSSSQSFLETQIDQYLADHPGRDLMAGAAIAVQRGEEQLIAKGYGQANMTWEIDMPADASFWIGSVTKQFTAVAILQLAEQSQISLEDVTIVALINTTGPVRATALTDTISRMILDMEPAKHPPFPGNLDRVTGTYEGPGRGRPLNVEAKAEGNTLLVRALPSPAWDTLSYRGHQTWEIDNQWFTFSPTQDRMNVHTTSGYFVLERR